MIILSGVLVVVAIALLVAAIVADNGDSAQVFGLDALTVIYISIGVSIVSVLCLAVGVFLRRKELFGTGAATAPARKSRKTPRDKRKKPAPPAASANAQGVPETAASTASAAPAADPADDAVEIPAPPVDVPADAMVFVVRGRKRYHLDTCRQLAGRETEELTYAEAKEEGFSPCTACMPDTALAARAAASGPASPDAGEAAGQEPAPAKPGAERAEAGLAGLAKPAQTPEPSGRPAPGAFDQTAEIPRADAPAAPEPPAPVQAPAPPTLTDMPAASLVKDAEDDAAEAEPAAAPAAERSAEPADAADGPSPSPFTAPAPKPRDAAAPTAETPEPEPAPAAESADESAGDDPEVRILSGTKRYHRTDCALIEDIGDEADDLESLSRTEAKSRGCTPCLVCQPDRERARD